MFENTMILPKQLIFHHSSYKGGNASEYIIPKGQIDITSHGMGSGIYGLSQTYLKENPPDYELTSSRYKFEINCPYIISKEEQCEKYISGSKTLSRYMEERRNSKKYGSTLVISEDEIKQISQEFVKIMNKSTNTKGNFEFDIKNVELSLAKFHKDYNERSDIVEMPINYVLKQENIGGVISKPGLSCHSWSKGDVKFISYPSYQNGDVVPVCFFLARKGISKHQLNLSRENYTYNDENNEWCKKH